MSPGQIWSGITPAPLLAACWMHDKEARQRYSTFSTVCWLQRTAHIARWPAQPRVALAMRTVQYWMS